MYCFIVRFLILGKDTLNRWYNKENYKILVPEDWNFYSVLSKKLHWNNGKDVA